MLYGHTFQPQWSMLLLTTLIVVKLILSTPRGVHLLVLPLENPPDHVLLLLLKVISYLDLLVIL